METVSKFHGRRRFPPDYYADPSPSKTRLAYYLPGLRVASTNILTKPDRHYLHKKQAQRVDVLHPPTVQRRTVALETGNQHAHNHSRVVNMQQKMYMDYINSRKPAFYGTARHREDYKRSLRESLKAQMQESADKRRHEFNRSCSESRKAISDFHSSSRAEMELSRSMLSNSRHYMEENKKIAEERRHYIREQRRLDLQRERELLLKTPINWSYTLK